MKSPWQQSSELESDRQYLVLASSIPPRSRWSTWQLFRGASATKRQLASTKGIVGFSLLARPIAKQYATLSVWLDEDSLDAFAGTAPHAQLMESLRDEMDGAKFVRWTIKGNEGPPTWSDALSRLAHES